MDILPDRKKFIDLAASSSRVPVCGEERIPNLDPFLLFKKLFQNSEQSFLLESGKGPIETAQFSIFGCSNSRVLKIFGKNNHQHYGYDHYDNVDSPPRLRRWKGALRVEGGRAEGGSL